MCSRIFRPTSIDRKAAIVPFGPLMLMCPMRIPVLVPMPARSISSSVHSVPSNSTTSAP
jgi:hypothetical protein